MCYIYVFNQRQDNKILFITLVKPFFVFLLTFGGYLDIGSCSPFVWSGSKPVCIITVNIFCASLVYAIFMAVVFGLLDNKTLEII